MFRLEPTTKVITQIQKYSKHLACISICANLDFNNLLGHVFENFASVSETPPLDALGDADIVIIDVDFNPALPIIEEMKNCINMGLGPRIALVYEIYTPVVLDLLNRGADSAFQKYAKEDQILEYLYYLVIAAFRDKTLKKLQHHHERESVEMRQRYIDLSIMALELHNRHAKEFDTEDPHAPEAKALSEQQLILLRQSYEPVTPQEYFAKYPLDFEHIATTIEEVEREIDLVFPRSLTLENKDDLSHALKEYAMVIEKLPEFNSLSYAVESLAESLSIIQQISDEKQSTELLQTFINNLHKWYSTIFMHQSTLNVHYLDAAIISDQILISSILLGERIHTENEIEFF